MSKLSIAAVSLAALLASHAALGQAFQDPPVISDANAELIRGVIRNQIPAVPYVMTPDELTDQERNGGTSTNEERAAQPGSQFAECESRLYRIGYSHAEQSTVCSGLSIHAPTLSEQRAFDAAKHQDFYDQIAAQRHAGEALRNKIAIDRATTKK